MAFYQRSGEGYNISLGLDIKSGMKSGISNADYNGMNYYRDGLKW